MNNLDQNSYSKVVQKEDEKAKDLINSYRFEIDNQKQYKKWNPAISLQDQLKLKKKREDNYIQKFDQKKRPVFLIKEKKAIQGMTEEQMFDDDQTESYYKATKNTYVIDDDQEEIQNEQQNVKRQTIVVQNKNKDGFLENDNQIYQIEGTEFLPQGFLELNPLLLKDDYDFENSEDEKLFKKEQAQIIALRRKQYTQKNYKKKRDVVILLLNEKIQAILNHLNEFYQQHKHVLSDEERQGVVKKFNISEQTLLDLEELFLHENGYWDSIGAEEYLMKYAKVKGQFLFVPSEAKELYKKRRTEIERQLRKMKELKKKSQDKKKNKKKKKVGSKSKSNTKKTKSNKFKPMSYFEKMQQRQKEIMKQKRKSKSKTKKSIDQQESQEVQQPQKKVSFKQNKVEIKSQPKEVKKIDEIEQKNFESFDPNRVKRVSIKQKDIYDNEKNIIILQPQTIGSTVYYQEVHNLKIQDQNQATVITKILDDIIISKQDIPQELQTQNYSNQLFDDDQDPNDPLKKYLIVYNDKNQTVAIQTLRPKIETCQNIDLANQEIFMMNNNDTFIRGKEFQHFKERVHTLNPVQIFGQIYQQKVVQLIRGDTEELKIITIEENGKIILKEDMQQEKNTKYFYNKQETQLNIEDKNYNIFLILCNENGEKINQQKFTKILDEDQLEYYIQRNQKKRQSLIIKKDDKNNKKRKISLPPFYHQNFLVLPTVEEKQNTVDIILRNEEGQVISKGQCDVKKKSEFYSIEIVNKEIQKNGQIKLTFFLKDDKDNVINVVFLDELNLIKEDDFSKNVRRATLKNNDDDIKNFSQDFQQFTTDPVILGNVYIHQIFQKPYNHELKATLITKTEYGDVLTTLEIVNHRHDITNVTTELLEVIKKNEFDDIYRIALKDDKGNSLNVQELQKAHIQFLSKRKIQIKDQFITNQSDEALTKKKEFKSIQYNDKTYNCQIQQILLNNSSKINIFSIKDNNENYYFAQQIENKQDINDYQLQTKTEEQTLVVCLIDQYDDVILSYKIDNDKIENDHEINFNSQVSKVYIDFEEESNTSNLIHYLKPVFVQEFKFCQIIEEKIFQKRNRQLIIKTYDNSKNVIDSKMLMKSESFGQNFQTRVNKILNTADSQNLVTLETLNEQKQIVSTINLKVPLQKEKDIIVNDKELDDEFLNEITISNTMFENIIDIQLLPVFIGDGYFYHVIQKITNLKDKKEQVFVLTYDKFDQMILKEEIFNLEGDCFTVKIVNEEKKDDFINVEINIINNEDTLIHIQKFKSQLSANLKNYFFTDFFDIYDKNKKKINQVAIQKQDKYTVRFVSLMPILIGNGFLLVSVNEILHNKQKQAVVVIKNQKGQLVTFKKIDQQLIGQYYLSKIVQDTIEKDKRIIRLQILNDNNDILGNFDLNPFQIQYDDFENQQNLLEMVDEDGKQFFYLLRKNNDNAIQVIDHQRKSVQDKKEKEETKINFIQRKSILEQIETKNLFSMKFNDEQLKQIKSMQSNNQQENNEQQFDQQNDQMAIEDIQSEFSHDQHENEKKDVGIESQQFQKQTADFEIFKNFQIQNQKEKKRFTKRQNYDYKVEKKTEEDYQPYHIGQKQSYSSQLYETNFKQPSYQDNLNHVLQVENLKNIYLKKSEYQDEIEEPQPQKKNLLLKTNFSFQQNSLNKLTSSYEEQDDKLKNIVDSIARKSNAQEKQSIIEKIQNLIEQNDLDYDDTLDQFYLFCQQRLPQDKTYKDGVKMMSLFYFFTQKFNKLQQKFKQFKRTINQVQKFLSSIPKHFGVLDRTKVALIQDFLKRSLQLNLQIYHLPHQILFLHSILQYQFYQFFFFYNYGQSSYLNSQRCGKKKSLTQYIQEFFYYL